jgi:hypothetical protein
LLHLLAQLVIHRFKPLQRVECRVLLHHLRSQSRRMRRQRSAMCPD